MAGNLQGKKVLVTREETNSRFFATLLEKEDALAHVFPLIDTTCRPLPKIRGRVDYEWVFFTSVKGVRCFFSSNVLREIGGRWKFAVIGPKTGSALEGEGFMVDFMPTVYEAKAMGEQFFKQYDVSGRILLVRGNRALRVLEEACVRRQVNYDCLVVYETTLVTDCRHALWDVLDRERMDFFTFSSPSIVTAFTRMLQGHPAEAVLKKTPAICIGPTTAKAAREAEFSHVSYPKVYTIEAMIDVMKYFDEGVGK